MGHKYFCESESCSIVSDSLQPHELYTPWISPGQNTGVGHCSLLQGVFLTQESNPGLPHCRQILYQLSHQGLFYFTYLFSAVLGLPRCLGFSLVAASRGYASLRQARASHCSCLSCCGVQALGCLGFSSCGSWALEHRLSSQGARAEVPRGMRDLPRPGIELVSPALAGRFFTIELPGKPTDGT